MKKRISDMMDCIQNPDVELNQQTPLSSQRIKELTMNNITNNRRKPRRTGFRLLVAAAIIAALTATVFAAGNLTGWFRWYFEKQNDTPLSPEQIEFIEENEQLVTEPQVQNNCTVELKSFMTDGQYMCMLLGVTAPEGVKIEDVSIANFGGETGILTPETDWTLVGTGQTMYIEDDGDGKDNTANIVFESMFEYEETEKPFDHGTVWNLHIEDLSTSCVDEAYLSQFEMVDGAYVLSGEEAALAYQTLTLVDGTWEYQFTVNDGDFREIAIVLEEPISASTVVGVKPMEDGSYVDAYSNVTITSIVLRSMGMTVHVADEYYAYSEACSVVMKDGSKVELQSYWSNHYCSRTPIVLDEVDHILLADGTKIMVP